MEKFTNPLDKIKIASPCSADWNKMFGNERKRFCADCQLNVYNLSQMTQEEAESFLIRSEGRVCLQIHRRKDGSIITKDCPVGWQKLKRKVSQIASATFALLAGFSLGIFGLNALKTLRAFTNYKEIPSIFFQKNRPSPYENEGGTKIRFGGVASNLQEIKEEIIKNQKI